MRKVKDFRFTLEGFHLVVNDGLPEEGDTCFVIWQCKNGEYDWHIGTYFEDKGTFWSNLGLGGGMVLDAKSIVAWIDWQAVRIKEKYSI